MSLFTKADHYADRIIYPSEEIEREMRDHNIYSPMTVWEDSLKYVVTTISGKIFPFLRATPERIEAIRQDLISYAKEHCSTVDEFQQDMMGIREIWSEVVDELNSNLGLVHFMEDWGAHSRSFFRFLDLVPQAIALESAFGANYDNAGVYHKLSPGCISRRCAVFEPIFVDLRRRCHHSNNLVRWAMNEHPEDYIVTLGCGLMVEFRKFGFTLEDIKRLHIIACDMNPELLRYLDVVFQHDFGVPFSESGIEYRECCIEDLLCDELLYGKASVVLLDGVMSYCKDEAHMLEYLTGMKKLLRPYGRIACDLQVMEPSLIKDALVLGWKSGENEPRMKPERNAKTAVRKLQRLSQQVGLDLQYEIDPRNPRPVGVYFFLGRNIGTKFMMPLPEK